MILNKYFYFTSSLVVICLMFFVEFVSLTMGATSTPTLVPVTPPVNVPTVVPTATPVAIPTTSPTGVPTTIPTGMPTMMPLNPTRLPTKEPTFSPTIRPFAIPTRRPTKTPSAIPTLSPTAVPTADPTASPTKKPTCQPTSQPTSSPTDRPSSKPSSRPSSLPTSNPTSSPTATPTASPTSLPTSNPTSSPTATPTSSPTLTSAVRYYQCASNYKDAGCSGIEKNCAFHGLNIIFQCVNATSECLLVSTTNFTLGPNSNITVEGGCDFTVVANSDISILGNSSITANAINLTAGKNIENSGILYTSGMGTVNGKGAPVGLSQVGYGGSYGGSGGRPTCNNSLEKHFYFSNTGNQVGSLDVVVSGNINEASFDYGSGGGFTGAGKGGGKVSLNAPNGHVSLYPSSTIMCEGSSPEDGAIEMGAGSGGSVFVEAKEVYQYGGKVSVKGGDVSPYSRGAAGGGGRVSMLITTQASHSDFLVNASDIIIDGGRVLLTANGDNTYNDNGAAAAAADIYNPYVDRACQGGAAGTLFVQYTNTSKKVAYVYVTNNFQETYATTLINALPVYAMWLGGASGAVVGTTSQQFVFQTRSDCQSNTGSYTFHKCSSLTLQNSSIVRLNNETEALINGGNVVESSALDIRVDYFVMNASSFLMSECYYTSFNITARYSVFLSSDSSIYYSNILRISASNSVVLDGTISQDLLPALELLNSTTNQLYIQPASYYEYSRLLVETDGPLQVSRVYAHNLQFSSGEFEMYGSGEISSPTPLKENCVDNLPSKDFTCSSTDFSYTGSLIYENTCIITSRTNMTFNATGSIQCAAIALCSPLLIVQEQFLINTQSRGCAMGSGAGAGQAGGSITAGGGGAGSSGAGGNGQNIGTNGGTVYINGTNLYAGSGGGMCASISNDYVATELDFGRGGGIVHIIAGRLELLGDINAAGGTGNGANSSLYSGGGSGGMIFIDAIDGEFSGHGTLTAAGGAGGNGLYPGGGGGGGTVSIKYNKECTPSCPQYSGVISVSGGAAGKQQAASNAVTAIPYSFRQSSSSSAESSPYYSHWADMWKDTSLLPPHGKSVKIKGKHGKYATSISTDAASTINAAAGKKGTLSLPSCNAGYGNMILTENDVDKMFICTPCTLGYYALNNNTGSCLKCNSIPNHAHYTSTKSGPNCPFACDAGYSTDQCYGALDNLLFHKLTPLGFAACLAGLLLLLIAPLAYLRYKRAYGRFYYDSGFSLFGGAIPKGQTLTVTTGVVVAGKGIRKLQADNTLSLTEPTSGTNTVISPLADGSNDPSTTPRRISATEAAAATAAAIFAAAVSADNNDKSVFFTTSRVNNVQTTRDQRLNLRLTDPDMPFHACRIYFLGSNHPFSSYGGPWFLSPARPVCLRPVLKKDDWRIFAEAVNASVSWRTLSLEVLIYQLTSFFLPPLAALVMKSYRKRRAATLLQAISDYDYSCFRCPEQVKSRNSLRIGISPDATLAYLDVLFDEDTFLPTARPLCPIGQARLPAAFKCAGLGTYCSPYYVDTNDMILQAVPHTDVASAFIDEAWIAFMIELNSILRTVNSSALHIGLRSVLRFLADKRNTAKLGGLVVELCTFSNVFQDTEKEEFGNYFHGLTLGGDSEEDRSTEGDISDYSDEDTVEAEATSRMQDNTLKNAQAGRASAQPRRKAQKLHKKNNKSGGSANIPKTMPRPGMDDEDEDDDFENKRTFSRYSEAANTNRDSIAPISSNHSIFFARLSFGFSSMSHMPGRSSKGSSGRASSHRESRLGFFEMIKRIFTFGDSSSSLLSGHSRRSFAGQKGSRPRSNSRAPSTVSSPELSNDSMSGSASLFDDSGSGSSFHDGTGVRNNLHFLNCLDAIPLFLCPISLLLRGLYCLVMTLFFPFYVLYVNIVGDDAVEDAEVYDVDPDGAFFTFNDTCRAISSGKLKMGIMVTHPKVSNNLYIIQDEDYESEEEAFYHDKTTVAALMAGIRQRKLARGALHDRTSFSVNCHGHRGASFTSTTAVQSPDIPISSSLSSSSAMNNGMEGSGAGGQRMMEYNRSLYVQQQAIVGSVGGGVPAALYYSGAGGEGMMAGTSVGASHSGVGTTTGGGTRGDNAETASLKKLYGNKVDEMARFRRMMQSADASMEQQLDEQNNKYDSSSRHGGGGLNDHFDSESLGGISSPLHLELQENPSPRANEFLGSRSPPRLHSHSLADDAVALADVRASRASNYSLNDPGATSEIQKIFQDIEPEYVEFGSGRRAEAYSPTPGGDQRSGGEGSGGSSGKSATSSSASKSKHQQQQGQGQGQEHRHISLTMGGSADTLDDEETKRRRASSSDSRSVAPQMADIYNTEEQTHFGTAGHRDSRADGNFDDDGRLSFRTAVAAATAAAVVAADGEEDDNAIAQRTARMSVMSELSDANRFSMASMQDISGGNSSSNNAARGRKDTGMSFENGTDGGTGDDKEGIEGDGRIDGRPQIASVTATTSSYQARRRPSNQVSRRGTKTAGPTVPRSSYSGIGGAAVSVDRSNAATAASSRQTSTNSSRNRRKHKNRTRTIEDSLLAISSKNLAPSGFQHRVNAWRLVPLMKDKAQPLWATTDHQPSPSNGERTSATAATDTPSGIAAPTTKEKELYYSRFVPTSDGLQFLMKQSELREESILGDEETGDTLNNRGRALLSAAKLASSSSSSHGKKGGSTSDFGGGNANIKHSKSKRRGNESSSHGGGRFFNFFGGHQKSTTATRSRGAATIGLSDDFKVDRFSTSSIDSRNFHDHTGGRMSLNASRFRESGGSELTRNNSTDHRIDENDGDDDDDGVSSISTPTSNGGGGGGGSSGPLRQSLGARSSFIGGGGAGANSLIPAGDWLPAAYFLQWVSLIVWQVLSGVNIRPFGPKYTRSVLEAVFLFLCIGDIFAITFLLLYMYCVSEDMTSCANHTSFYEVIFVWPGGILIAPLMGIVAMILGPSGKWSRLYAMWSRVAAINVLVIARVILDNWDFFNSVKESLYLCIYLFGSRGAQICLIDLYIAHIEKLRYTRGWDGIHTSLFKTKDNKNEIIGL